MTNKVNELKSQGFIIARATSSRDVKCTMIWHKTEFWFCDAITKQNLKRAHFDKNLQAYVLYIPGMFVDEEIIPFEVFLSQSQTDFADTVISFDYL